MYTFNLNIGLDYLSIFVSSFERSWSVCISSVCWTTRIVALRIGNISPALAWNDRHVVYDATNIVKDFRWASRAWDFQESLQSQQRLFHGSWVIYHRDGMVASFSGWEPRSLRAWDNNNTQSVLGRFIYRSRHGKDSLM
jgi:hypothetical protein